MAMSGWRSPGGEGRGQEPLSSPPEELPGAAALLETRNLLRILVAAVVIAALQAARDVFIPVILAVILSFVLSPLVNLLGRAGLRPLAAARLDRGGSPAATGRTTGSPQGSPG